MNPAAPRIENAAGFVSAEKKLDEAERAAAPTAEAIASAAPRSLFHRTTNWSAEQQWAFNRSIAAALAEMLRACEEIAGEQRAKVAHVAQEVGAAIAGSERLHEVQSRVQQLESEMERFGEMLQALQQSIDASRKEQRESLEQSRKEHQARDDSLRKEQQEQAEMLRAEHRRSVESSSATHAEQLGQLRSEFRTALADLQREQAQAIEILTNEQRERIQHLLDEERVCVRQLSLQSSEEAVLADRARRATEARLDQLARALEQLSGNQRS